MDPVALQKQVRDNSEDLKKYLGDLQDWQEEIKQKEQTLSATGKVAKVRRMFLHVLPVSDRLFDSLWYYRNPFLP
jgi:phage shock protein A